MINSLTFLSLHIQHFLTAHFWISAHWYWLILAQLPFSWWFCFQLSFETVLRLYSTPRLIQLTTTAGYRRNALALKSAADITENVLTQKSAENIIDDVLTLASE